MSTLGLSCVCLSAVLHPPPKKKNRASFAPKSRETRLQQYGCRTAAQFRTGFYGSLTNRSDYFKNSVSYDTRTTTAIVMWNSLRYTNFTRLKSDTLASYHNLTRLKSDTLSSHHNLTGLKSDTLPTRLKSKRSDTNLQHTFDRKLQQWEFELCKVV